LGVLFLDGGILAHRTQLHKPVSDETRRALAHCKRFRTLKNDKNAEMAKSNLLRKVQMRDGNNNAVRARRCQDFEAAQLINLMPGTAEEALALIPTLKAEMLPSLLADLHPLREFDRAIV